MQDVLTATAIPAARPGIRRINTRDISDALRKGFADFVAIPTQLVFLCLLYPIIGMVAARMATGDLLPLLFPLVTGLSLMGPVLAIGLYEISRRREAGQPASWLNAFDVLRSPALPGIVAIGALLLVVFTLWLAAARMIYIAAIGPEAPAGIGAFINLVMHTSGGMKLILWGNIVGFAFALFVLTISVVSIPMLLDRNCTPQLAIQTSIRVVTHNPIPMALWGLTVATLLILGSLPFFVGLAVAMPILGHATWHLYRRVVI